jgi:hypothetical protein
VIETVVVTFSAVVIGTSDVVVAAVLLVFAVASVGAHC